MLIFRKMCFGVIGVMLPAECWNYTEDCMVFPVHALALKAHKKELCECTDQERADFAEDLAKASGAIKELWGCTKLNLGSFGDTNPHLHFHIVPKYEGGFEFGGAFAITNPEPVYLTDGEYQEMISALKAKLGI